MKRSYWKNILVGLDQFIGTLFGIDADETISSYVGRNYPGSWKEKALDFVFGKGHCQASIEWDEVE